MIVGYIVKTFDKGRKRETRRCETEKDANTQKYILESVCGFKDVRINAVRGPTQSAE